MSQVCRREGLNAKSVLTVRGGSASLLMPGRSPCSQVVITAPFHLGLRPQRVYQKLPPPVSRCLGVQTREMFQCALPSDQTCAMWELEPQMCGGHRLHSLDLSSPLAWARHRLSEVSIGERRQNVNFLLCSLLSAPAGVKMLPAT